MEANKEMQNNLTPNSTVPQSSQPQFQSQPQLQPKPSKAKKKLSKRAILAIVLVVVYSVVLVIATVKVDRFVLEKRLEKVFSSAFDGTADENSANTETNDDMVAGSKLPAQNKLSAMELEAQLAEQPVVVLSTSVLVQSDEYKGLYPDLLSAVVQNNSGTEIKTMTIGFVAWDANNLPVRIAGQYDFDDGTYFKEVTAEDVNLVNGATYGDEQGLALSDDCDNIKTIKAIVTSYTDFDGNTWENPLVEDFRAVYENQRLV